MIWDLDLKIKLTKLTFGLNISYFKVTMIIQTDMTYTQKIGIERKHKLI